MILIYKYDTSIYCDWLTEMIISIYWEISCFQPLFCEISVEICECYGCLYVMVMIIMHARNIESKTWDICKSTYSMFMHDYVQEMKEIIRTCKGMYRVSTSQWVRAVLSKTWASPQLDLRGIELCEGQER